MDAPWLPPGAIIWPDSLTANEASGQIGADGARPDEAP